MASVNDYGGPTDSLASVPFGGVGGWAEAVAAALDNSDEPVGDRFVEKTGDEMTGALTINRNGGAALVAKSAAGSSEIWTDRAGSGISGLRIHVDGKVRWLIADDGTRLAIARYNPTTGAWVQTALGIDGNTGDVYLGNTTPAGDSSVTTRGYVNDTVGRDDGSSVAPSVVLAGTVTVPVNAGSSSGVAQTVTFKRPFGGVPRVTATARGTSVYFPFVWTGPTETSFSVAVRHFTNDTTQTVNISVDWVAVGPR